MTAAEALAALGASQAGLTTTEATALLAREGANEVPQAAAHPIKAFARKFWGLSAWMIEEAVGCCQR